MTTAPTTVLWIRQCLRMQDNAALHAAASAGPFVPVYCHAPSEEGDWVPGEASQWWLHHSLNALTQAYAAKDMPLILRRTDDVAETLLDVCQTVGAVNVVYDVRYESAALDQVQRVKAVLAKHGITAEGHHTNTIFHPNDWPNKQGKPYQVYTPFWKHCHGDLEVAQPPQSHTLVFHKPDKLPKSDDVNDWGLLPKLNWADGFATHWQPGEVGSHAQLQRFLKGDVVAYDTVRDHPGEMGTSRLSPHLHYGEISPQRVWHVVRQAMSPQPAKAEWTYLKELVWREFAYQIVVFFPTTPTEPLKPAFNAFPWDNPPSEILQRWQQGQTGYPIVDAGLRELWHTGWMHNRVRMIVASFLIKHLRVHWLEGARWFWDTLVDADLASNTMGWQWVAGCGPDASPYFRIFNPMLQGAKFDPKGSYIRRWVPELATLDDKFIHQPWEAPSLVLQAAGITLGVTYPHPMVDHASARDRALAGYEYVKAAKTI